MLAINPDNRKRLVQVGSELDPMLQSLVLVLSWGLCIEHRILIKWQGKEASSALI